MTAFSFRATRLGLMLATCLFVTPLATAQDETPSELQKRIIGNWKVDVAKTTAFHQQKDPAQAEIPAGDLDELGKLQVRFLADGVVQVLRDGKPMQGRWKFVKQVSPQSAEIELIRDDEATPASIEFTPDGGMAVAPANERPLVFVPAPTTPPSSTPAAEQTTGEPLELGPLGGKYVGHWKADAAETKKLEFNSQFDPQQVTDMLEQMKDLDVHVAADGAFAAKFGLPDQVLEMSGTWRPAEENAEQNTLDVQVNLQGGPNTKFNILFLDDKTIRMAPADQPAIILRRQAPASGPK